MRAALLYVVGKLTKPGDISLRARRLIAALGITPLAGLYEGRIVVAIKDYRPRLNDARAYDFRGP
jgi:hypothetical protein